MDQQQIDPAEQERILERYSAVLKRYNDGEITREEFDELSLRAFIPDDPEALERARAIRQKLKENGMEAAIETACRLPGVEIPAGRPDEN